MLLSQINKWHWLITWDNPVPANSSTMLKELGKLGAITPLQAKTTVLLAPKASVTWKQIRQAIDMNLHPKKGKAAYANLRTQNAFHRGPSTKHVWKRAN